VLGGAEVPDLNAFRYGVIYGRDEGDFAQMWVAAMCILPYKRIARVCNSWLQEERRRVRLLGVGCCERVFGEASEDRNLPVPELLGHTNCDILGPKSRMVCE
jgi:hypothetical protein